MRKKLIAGLVVLSMTLTACGGIEININTNKKAKETTEETAKETKEVTRNKETTEHVKETEVETEEPSTTENETSKDSENQGGSYTLTYERQEIYSDGYSVKIPDDKALELLQYNYSKFINSQRSRFIFCQTYYGEGLNAIKDEFDMDLMDKDQVIVDSEDIFLLKADAHQIRIRYNHQTISEYSSLFENLNADINGYGCISRLYSNNYQDKKYEMFEANFGEQDPANDIVKDVYNFSKGDMNAASIVATSTDLDFGFSLEIGDLKVLEAGETPSGKYKKILVSDTSHDKNMIFLIGDTGFYTIIVIDDNEKGELKYIKIIDQDEQDYELGILNIAAYDYIANNYISDAVLEWVEKEYNADTDLGAYWREVKENLPRYQKK